MPLYFPRKPEPPVQAQGPIFRGQMSFTQRMNYARGIRATTAGEATQLIPLIEQLLGQVSKFITSRSQQEAFSATKAELTESHGTLPVITGPTYMTNEPQDEPEPAQEQTGFSDEVEPFPEDDSVYSDEDKQERVEELQQALEKSVERDSETATVPAPKKRGRPKKK